MELTNTIDSAIKEAEKMHEKYLIDMLNNHGVLINKENLEEYDGLIGIRCFVSQQKNMCLSKKNRNEKKEIMVNIIQKSLSKN